MKRAFWLFAALLAFVALAARADDDSFRATYIGEGGGYKAPDRATDQFLQGGLGGSARPAPVTRPSSALPAPSAPPRSSSASGGSSSVVAAASPAPSAVPPRTEGTGAGVPRPAGRRSLWNGLIQPLDMAPAQAETADADEARAGVDRDYDSHILAIQEARPRPSFGALETRTPAGVSTAGGNVFVSVELNPREAGSLRDAVAGLGAATGFSVDARFEAMSGPDGAVLISGWIPSARLATALGRPGVKRLHVQAGGRPSVGRETSGDFVVGLRVDDSGRARAGVDAGVRALASTAGFRLTRIVGLETAPDGRAVAVVEGRLPLARLSKALGLSEVAKISPVGGEPSAARATAPAPSPVGFARFVVQRWPWLILLTLLLALPGLRSPARRFFSIFSPYR